MRATEFIKEQKETVDVSSIVTPDLKEIFKVFKSAGHDIKIAGGAVRDLLLGKEPKDIDLASTATPDEMVSLLKDFRTIPTGLEHGTMTVLGRKSGEEFEITTLRIDTNQDGRHADVEWTRDFKLDADRRDLTFNSMFLDLDGTLHDFHGGKDDLLAGKARFVGNASERMDEDFLRILRFFRFQGRMATPNWDKDTINKIKEKASGLSQISGERVWSEVSKILKGNHTVELLKKMKETDVAKHINLPLDNLNDLAEAKKTTKSPSALLSTLLDTTEQAIKLRSLWKFSNPELATILFIIENRDKAFDLTQAKLMLAKPKAQPAHVMKLASVLGKTSIISQLRNWKAPVFPVQGKDLIAAGMKPGPEFGSKLSMLRSKWEKSGFELTKQQLLSTL